MTSMEDLPSCSKMNTEGTKVGDTIINKYPVVLLTKLDPDIISMKVNPEDMQLFEKQQKVSSLHRKANKIEASKGYSDDEDAVLSDVSVAMSDDESIASEELESNKSSRKDGIESKTEVKKEIKKTHSSDKKTSAGKAVLVGKDNKNETKKPEVPVKDKLIASLKSDGNKTSKQSTETETSSTITTVKMETDEKTISYLEQAVKDKKHNLNARYKLALGPFSVAALESEPFRKFINLASDCAISFNKKENALSSVTGNVVLFFGDCLTLQSAMQRLSQLSVFADKSLVKGSITCMEIKQIGKKNVSKDQSKANIIAELFFQFYTGKRDKLQQLISSKGRKKEDTKRKCVQVHRIPSPINEEMLSLLFPFSVGVKISGTESSEKDIKGPVEIEFENQEWMEAVLICFKDFSVSTSKMRDRLFNLIIKNFIPPKERPIEKAPLSTVIDRQKQVTGVIKSKLFQGDKIINRGRGITNTRNLGTGLKTRPLLHRPLLSKPGLLRNKDDQRKRAYPVANFGQRRMDIRQLAVKRSRLDSAAHVRGLVRPDMMVNNPQSQQINQAEVHQDALRQIALAKSLDSNNPDVIRILEMTTHLEKLQSLRVQQTAEVQSLGFVGMPGQQVVSEHKLHKLKQAQEEAEVRRYHAAVQAKNLRFRELEEAKQAENAWSQGENLWQVEMARRKEEEERRILEERRQLEERRLLEERRQLEERRRLEERRHLEYQTEIKRNEIIAGRLKQLEDFDLLSRQGIPFQREGHRGPDSNPRLAMNYFPKEDGPDEFRPKKIQAFGHAPPTSGLLGAAPPGLLNESQHDSMYTGNDGPGFRSPDKNMPRKKLLRRQNVADDQPSSNKPAPRTQRINTLFAQKSANSGQAFRKRSQDMRNSEGNNRQTQDNTVYRKFTGKKSRWDTVEDSNSFEQMEPNRNDMPLDFNRPQARITTEQAFKQDIERTRAVLATHGNVVQERSFKSKSILKNPNPLLEEVRDRHSLPVQFGKNAAKKVPRQIGRNLNTFNDVSGVQDQGFNERWDTGSHQRGDNFQDKHKGLNAVGDRRKTLDFHRDMTNARGLLGPGGEVNVSRSSQNFPRGGFGTKGVQRDRLLNNGQTSARKINQNQSAEQPDAYGYDTQWRKNVQEQSRNEREQESGRGQASNVWQQLRERQMYLEQDQEQPQAHLYPESDDYGRNEWNKHGGHFIERGYRTAEDRSEQPRGVVKGLLAKPPLYDEEGQANSYFGTAIARRPYESNEASGDYPGEATFGKESYQTARAFGAGKTSQSLRPRGGLLGREGGRGNVNEPAHGRGLPSMRNNAQLHDQGSGRGLLELPEHFKQQEAAYYGEGNDAHYRQTAGTHQLHALGRNSQMQPPPMLGHGVNFF